MTFPEALRFWSAAQEASSRKASRAGEPGGAVQTISFWSGSVAEVKVFQSRVISPMTG